MVGANSTQAGPALLCFDGSEGARRAVDAASAVVGDGRAVVAHVWTPLMSGAFRYGPDIKLTDTVRAAAAEMDEAGERNAAAVAEEGAALARRAGFDPVEVVVEPAPEGTSAKLLEIANRIDASLVVVGAGGRRALGGLVGSVCHALANRSERPVLIVPHQPGPG